MPDAPRIALVHATPVAMAPIHEALRTGWPEAQHFDLLESALSADAGSYPPGIIDFDARFAALTRYALDIGANGILFTCSAFGTAIDRAAQMAPHMPILKPNEAMFDAALATGGRVTMLATFAPAVPEMQKEFQSMAAERGADAMLEVILAEGAMDALRSGDAETHDRLCADAARSATGDVVMLAHFSTARAAPAVERVVQMPVLTSPGSAVEALKARCAAQFAAISTHGRGAKPS